MQTFLNFEKVDVPLGGGVDQGTQQFLLDMPRLAKAQNVRFRRKGSFEKRAGEAIVTPLANGSLRRLLTHQDKLLAITTTPTTNDNSPAQLYAHDLNAAVLRRVGPEASANAVSEARIYDRVPISRSATDEQINPDVAYISSGTASLIDNAVGRHRVVVWQSQQTVDVSLTNGIYGAVFDATTSAPDRSSGAQIVAARKVTDGECPRIVKSSTKVYVLAGIAGGDGIVQCSYTPSTETWSASSTLISDVPVGNIEIFDAVAGSDGAWYVAYRSSANQINIKRYTADTTTVSHTATITTDDPTGAIGLHVTTGEHLYVTWSRLNAGSYEIRYAVRSAADLTSVLAATTIASQPTDFSQVCPVRTGVNGTISEAHVVWTRAHTSTDRSRTYVAKVKSDGTVGSVFGKSSITLVSRPILFRNVVYANVVYDANPQQIGGGSGGFETVFTLAICDAAGTPSTPTTFRVAASWLRGYAGTVRSKSCLSNFVTSGLTADAAIYDFANMSEFQFFTAARQDSIVTGRAGTDLCRVDFGAYADTKTWCPLEFGASTHLTGGYHQLFDGVTLTEHGFNFPPEQAKMSIVAGGGSLSAGDYMIKVFWEYRHANGEIERSAPADVYTASNGLTLTAAANDRIDLAIPFLGVTQKYKDGDRNMNVVLRVARTEANGQVYYLDELTVSTVTGLPITAENRYDLDGSLAIRLTQGDSTLRSNELLYTTGGMPANYPFPTCDCIVSHQNRLFGIPSEDRRTIAFSHELQEGEVPCFHPNLTLRIDSDGDNIALASVDDKLFVFKRDAIWVIFGNGPNRRGDGTSYTAQRHPSAVGCIDWRSVVRLPIGVVFNSRAGLQLLGRDENVVFIGEGLRSETDYGITRAVAVPDEHCAHLLCGLSSRYRYVYDWNVNEWAQDDVRLSASQSDATFPTIRDWSATANHATATNMESTDLSSDTPPGATVAARSLLLDGVDEYCEAPANAALNFDRTSSFSIAYWFKAALTSEGIVFAKTPATGGATNDPGYYASVTSAGEVVFLLGIGTSNRIVVKTTTTGFDDNQWHHVVVTYNGNGAASGVTIYVDGTSRTKTVIQDNLGINSTLNTAAHRIGRLINGVFPFNGLLKDVAVYNKELSSGEVSGIYGGGTLMDLTFIGPTSYLVAYYRGGDATASYPSDAVYHRGELYTIHENDARITRRAWTRSTGTQAYLDFDIAGVELSVATSWIKLAGLQGYKRVRWLSLLAEKLADHGLTIKVAYDYSDSLADTYTLTSTEIAAMVNGTEQAKVHLARQVCQAIKATLTDAPAVGGTSTAGPRIAGLALDVGFKPGVRRLPAVNMR